MSTNSHSSSSPTSPSPSGDVSPANSSGAPPSPPEVVNVRIGGSYTLEKNVPFLERVLRKRTRNGGDVGAGPSVPPQLRAAVPPASPTAAAVALAAVFTCCICNLEFDSEKRLSGHMRMHPDRPWRGMYPPPVFTAEDFADVRYLLNDPEEQENAAADGAADGGGEAADGGGEAADGGGDDGEGEFGGRRWILPDLNETP